MKRSEMDALESRQRILSHLKWAPLEVGLCLVLLLISLWRAPFSGAYLIASLGLGLLYGALLIIGYIKDRFDVVFAIVVCVMVVGQMSARYALFPIRDETASGWRLAAQQFAIVWAAILTLSWVCRKKMEKSLAKSDVEQIGGTPL